MCQLLLPQVYMKVDEDGTQAPPVPQDGIMVLPHTRLIVLRMLSNPVEQLCASGRIWSPGPRVVVSANARMMRSMDPGMDGNLKCAV